MALHLTCLAQPQPALLAPDAAWCWFGNPRALFKDGQLYFGYVRFSDGRVGLNTYDPQTQVLSNLWLSGMVQKDDHDNPALLPLGDGRLLAIYQKHGSETRFYYRLSTGPDASAIGNWGPELLYTNTTAGVTYANPYQLAAESGRIYNFMRNLNFNPTLVTSDASGTNWSAPQILIKTGTGGTRPYVQYCSDYSNRIDFTYTDAHPTDAGTNCLYHAYYSNGALYKTDGTFLKYLTNAPLLHDSGERGSLIYQYSTAPTNDPNDHIQYGRAWCWDVAYQTNGDPVSVFSVQRTNVMGANWSDDRIYYYYARWTGTNWQKRFIAHAGRPLYSTQRDYAGGISIDPARPETVYLASNAADPFNVLNTTNVPLRANDRYEIFRGTTADGGLTFTWQQVTTNSVVDNLRPYVPRGNSFPCGVIWYAGTYTSYTSWNTAAYGLFTTNVVAVTVTPNTGPVITLSSPSSSPIIITNPQNSLHLFASVADDGGPGPVSSYWRTASGPADAIFADPTVAQTTVNFSQTGLYVLRLTADDTARTNSSDLMVLVGDGGALDTDPALALWLKLDESIGTTAVDSSGYGNIGAVYGNAAWNPANGPRNGALELNGTNSFVNVADSSTLDNTPALTLAFWFRADAYTTGGAGLVSKRNSISDNNAYTTFLQTDHFVNVDLDGSNNRFTSATHIDTNRWYHLAITFDGSQPTNQRARLYLNGALERIAAETSPAIPNYNSSVKLGLTHSNATSFLNGALADVRLYQRALDDAEIASLASLAIAPSVDAGAMPRATNQVPASLNGSASGAAKSGPLMTWWSQISGPATVTFGSSNQTAGSVTFHAAGQYVLRLSASNGAAQVSSDLPVTVSPNPNVYIDWISLAFPGATNPAVIAGTSDPDGDAAQNLLEFALGMDPTRVDAVPFGPGRPGLPIGSLQVFTGTRYLALTLQRPVGQLGIVYVAEVSADLANWIPGIQEGGPVANGDGTETVVFRDTVPADSAPRRFIRLRVSMTGD